MSRKKTNKTNPHIGGELAAGSWVRAAPDGNRRLPALRARRKWRYWPRGVETSASGGGVNSNMDAETDPRV
jgi:hypothetical protein